MAYRQASLCAVVLIGVRSGDPGARYLDEAGTVHLHAVNYRLLRLRSLHTDCSRLCHCRSRLAGLSVHNQRVSGTTLPRTCVSSQSITFTCTRCRPIPSLTPLLAFTRNICHKIMFVDYVTISVTRRMSDLSFKLYTMNTPQAAVSVCCSTG